MGTEKGASRNLVNKAEPDDQKDVTNYNQKIQMDSLQHKSLHWSTGEWGQIPRQLSKGPRVSQGWCWPAGRGARAQPDPELVLDFWQAVGLWLSWGWGLSAGSRGWF